MPSTMKNRLIALRDLCDEMLNHPITHWDLVFTPHVAAECGEQFLKKFAPAVDDVLSAIADLSLPCTSEYDAVLSDVLDGNLLYDLDRAKERCDD